MAPTASSSSAAPMYAPEMAGLDARLGSFKAAPIASSSSSSSLKNRKPSSSLSQKWPYPSGPGPLSKRHPTADKLARLGLYFSPTDKKPDRVLSYLDGSSLAGFSQGEVVENRIAEEHPNNPWLLIYKSRDAGEEVDGGMYEYEEEGLLPDGQRLIDARRATFGDQWPHDGKKGWKCTSQKLAQAGFHYEPTEDDDDNASCIYCGRTLSGWEKSDDPVHEHVRKKPECPVFNSSLKVRSRKNDDIPEAAEKNGNRNGKKGKGKQPRSKSRATTDASEVEDDLESHPSQPQDGRQDQTEGKSTTSEKSKRPARQAAATNSVKSVGAAARKPTRNGQVDAPPGEDDSDREAETETTATGDEEEADVPRRRGAAARPTRKAAASTGKKKAAEKAKAKQKDKGGVLSTSEASAPPTEDEADTAPNNEVVLPTTRSRSTRSKTSVAPATAPRRTTRSTRSKANVANASEVNQSDVEELAAAVAAMDSVVAESAEGGEATIVHHDENDVEESEATSAKDAQPHISEADQTATEAKLLSTRKESQKSSKSLQESFVDPTDGVEVVVSSARPARSISRQRQRVISANQGTEATDKDEEMSPLQSHPPEVETEDHAVALSDDVAAGALPASSSKSQRTHGPQTASSGANSEATRDVPASGSQRQDARAQMGLGVSSSSARATSRNADGRVFSPLPARATRTASQTEGNKVDAVVVSPPTEVETAALREQKGEAASVPNSTASSSPHRPTYQPPTSFPAPSILKPASSLPPGLLSETSNKANLSVQAYLSTQIDEAIEEMRLFGEEKIREIETGMKARRSEIESVLRGTME